MLAQTPQRILIIRPSALGDVCRSVAVLASLRHAFPQARIEWVVQEEFAPAVQAHPALDEVIAFPRARLANWWKSTRGLLNAVGWFLTLRKRRFDLVIDCQGLGRSGLMSFVTGAPQRIGSRDAREFAWLGYNRRAPRDRNAAVPIHTVDQMLMLVEAIGIEPQRDMHLYASRLDLQWWNDYCTSTAMQDSRYAVLAPGSRWLSKRWPIDRFAQLIEPLLKRGFAKVIVIGSPGEAEQIKPLFDATRNHITPHVIDFVGKTSIGQTMAVIAKADLVVANDSAPLHMAVGFDRPCVGLFGPTDPAEVGPYRHEESVVRGYQPSPAEIINFKNPKLGDSLMRFISTVAVLQKIDQVLAAHSNETGESSHEESSVVKPRTARASP